ncbi:hypothetical protein C1X61_01825 [Pseudomonas sp. FW215-T2]|nr:hypothetical protein C1X61_01825 [Pseudomonas sp. FW215-T2]PNA16784.1 hypothetical protein C1X62_01500 [Pseudomonas sp. FW215-R3]PNB39687.1 hypothetical protein C1X63_01960 [Pseudomonas sp. FW305-131]
MLAKGVNDDAGFQNARVALRSIASKLAPTVSAQGRMRTLGFSCGLFVLGLRLDRLIHDTVQPA